LAGYIKLGAHLYSAEVEKSGPWNFGPEMSDMKEVEEVLSMAFKHLDRGGYKIMENSNLHEAGILKLNNHKAKVSLGWLPKYTLEEAVKKTVDWYKLYYTDKARVVDFTKTSIQEYFEGENV